MTGERMRRVVGNEARVVMCFVAILLTVNVKTVMNTS